MKINLWPESFIHIAKTARLAVVGASLLAGIGVSCIAESADLKHVRAVHMMGDWLGNSQGFKEPMPILENAESLAAASVSVDTSRQGTIDIAVISLADVVVGESTTHARAGFYVFREIATGSIGIQFKPEQDSNLSDISGFSGGEINIILNAPGSTDLNIANVFELDSTNGDALQFILAVLAHAPEVLAGGDFTVGSGAEFGDEASLIEALSIVRASLANPDDAYFEFLESMNVEWLGISIGLHYDSYSDPSIRVRNCPNGFTDSGGNDAPCAIPEDDLRSFIGRAKSRGFNIYLTLALEHSGDLDSLTDPACGTPDYKMSRWLLGLPLLPNNHPAFTCITQQNWWWDPAHPDYASKTTAFFNSYTSAATSFAALAEETGVDLYSLGTETDFLFRTRSFSFLQNNFLAELNAMVNAVRAVYSGHLTYDQGYGVLAYPELNGGADGTIHLFNDLNLDVVGISAYFLLTDNPPGRVMSVEELEVQWESLFNETLEPLRTLYPAKPIMFLEMGYTDHLDSTAVLAAGAGEFKPPFDSDNPTQGMLQQQNILESFYNVNSLHGDLIAGTFHWGHDYFPYSNNWACERIDWSVRCTPAKLTVARAYENWRSKDVDRVFAWAEATFPQYFPSSQVSIEDQGYRFRFYPQTETYLAMKDERIIVHNGTTWNVLDVGSLREFIDMAGAAGF